MPKFERVCPECGASNSYNVSNCVKCRAPLTGGTAPQTPQPALLSRRMVAALAWRATKFLARKGFNIARDGTKRGIEKVQKRHQEDVKNDTIDADYKVSEWRVWSARTDKEKTAKTERVEWGGKK